MNFYKAQDQARKQTSWLLFLFFISVMAIVLITNMCVAVFVWYSNPSNLSNVHLQPELNVPALIDWFRHIVIGLGWYKFLWVTCLVCGVIGISMGFKWLSLRDGGRVVAESLGGRVLVANTNDMIERRLLNVVEEIALASGVPVPPVYLMDNEQGINAFAAGLSLEDAVIGVTRGTAENLNREELQGVIAHEFSHILNGDMRLNMQLLATLHGILMIGETGRTIMRHSSRRSHSYSSSRKGSNGGFVLLGLSLWLIGLIGQFFGALIKSAVSRQREFLADASAVQFTRNPEGIGGALKKIGGYHRHSSVHHNKAHEVGHLFFSSAYSSLMSLFATHPPLENRISRVLPSWDGNYLQIEKQSGRSEERYASFAGAATRDAHISDSERSSSVLAKKDSTRNHNGEMITFTLEGSGSVPNENVSVKAKTAVDVLFSRAKVLAHEPLGAVSLVLSLLMDDDKKIQFKQMSGLEQADSRWAPLAKETKILLDDLNSHDSHSNQHDLQLLELAIPTLKQLSLKQYQKLRETLSMKVNADGRVELFEWVLYQLVRQYCDRHFALTKAQKAKYKTVKQIAEIYEVVLSRVVHYGGGSDEQKAKAFNKACNAAGTYTIKLLPIESCSQAKFTRAVHALGLAYPLLKPRLIKGLINAAQSDAHINDHERQVIRGVATVMDCPLIGLEL